MHITALDIPDVRLVAYRRHADARGFFCETFVADAFAEAGLPTEWAQDNEAFSHAPFTIRGLHMQVAPFAQAKLVRAARGAILDVAVDVRPESPTFGRHVAVTLSAEAASALFVPVGFAHGYCTLAPDTLVQYKTSSRYAPACERALNFRDPQIAIAWPPETRDGAIVSDKDATAPLLEDFLRLYRDDLLKTEAQVAP